MTTLNTNKVDASYEHDPFTEYEYTKEVHQPQESQQSSEPQVVESVDQKKQLLKNIDDMFDGADFVFDIAEKFLKRLGGR